MLTLNHVRFHNETRSVETYPSCSLNIHFSESEDGLDTMLPFFTVLILGIIRGSFAMYLTVQPT